MKKLHTKMSESLVGFVRRFIVSEEMRRKIRKIFCPASKVYINHKDTVSKIRKLSDPVTAWRNFVIGLDDDSAITATRSLAITDSDYSKLSEILTPREYNDYMYSRIKLKTGVFKIHDECYAFGKYLLPVNQFGYSVFCARHGIDTIDLSKIQQDSVIIDAGGYIGDSALVLCKYFKNKIYSFEAMQENYELLLKTIKLNDAAERIIPVRCALSDGKTKLFSDVFTDNHYKNSGSKFYGSFRTSNMPSGEELPNVALDDYVIKHDLKVALIKVDVEGGEQSFLHGAKETITRDKPILLLSIYHSWNDLDYFKIKEMIESWDLGYTFRLFKPMDNTVLGETLLICEQ